MDILLPKLGFNMDEGTLVEWLAENGAAVVEGQPLYVLESDKSAQEISAPAAGRLTVIAEPGQTYPVGETLGRIE